MVFDYCVLFRAGCGARRCRRSLQNFDIGGERERMPVPIIRAFGAHKKVHRYKVKPFFFLCVFLSGFPSHHSDFIFVPKRKFMIA